MRYLSCLYWVMVAVLVSSVVGCGDAQGKAAQAAQGLVRVMGADGKTETFKGPVMTVPAADSQEARDIIKAKADISEIAIKTDESMRILHYHVGEDNLLKMSSQVAAMMTNAQQREQEIRCALEIVNNPKTTQAERANATAQAIVSKRSLDDIRDMVMNFKVNASAPAASPVPEVMNASVPAPSPNTPNGVLVKVQH